MALVIGVVLGSAQAGAVVPRPTARIAADTLTAMPAAAITKPLRTQAWIDVRSQPPQTFHRFVAAAGGTWQATWDRATGVPSRIWGSGIAVPGSIASPDVAERAARQLLADHVALLAPGSSASDFELVSNSFDGNVRSVGFVQRAGGLRVVGGQVSFRFKADRMFVIGSEALPDVKVAAVAPRIRLASTAMRDRAAAALRDQLALPNAIASLPEPDVVLPLLADDAVLGYRVVARMELDGGADGRYAAYVDPASGGVVAIHQLNTYATGTVLYHSVDRYPGRGYIDRPAPRAYVALDGTSVVTSVSGVVVWSPDVQQTLAPGPTGDLVGVTNKAMGGVATAQLSIDPGGMAVWDASAVVDDDAQVNAYIDTNIAKEYVRAFLDPNMPKLDAQFPVNVNINQQCNAFFDGKSLNFFDASPANMCNMKQGTCCENTARLQDVNFHEFGHNVHTSEIIPGVGAFEGAMSEGAADFLAASITGDHGMGRGFFYTDAPLRDLDNTATWPIDVGEIHHTGLIFGGSFWDLRVALIAQLGSTAGVAVTDAIYVGVLRRATGIPSVLIEALVTDDDNGNLADGTPHECAIRAAFGKHGLRTAGGYFEAPGAINDNALAIGVAIDVTGLSARCAQDAVTSAQLAWRPSFFGMPAAGKVDAMAAGPNRFWAELPLAVADSVLYQARIGFADNGTLVLPDNIADPFYQLYQGPTTKLYCTDFETDPFADGWTQGADDGQMMQFQWGAPSGHGTATSPPAAFSGTNILAEVLDGDYPDASHAWVAMPRIFVGQYSDVRLQYRRWLAVEDSHFDQARILANDTKAWVNFTQAMGGSSSFHHIDKEWRFHDLPLSPWFFGHSVQVAWDLKSDPGLHFAGWNLDDVCIVANVTSICGDGVLAPYEQCDNGAMNADKPNVCRTDCRLPACGDGIVDTGEECDDGIGGSPTCSTACKRVQPQNAGCCSATGGATSITFGGLALALMLRRRRRRA
jgi:uncharacterized protein (TIGR03382 family)